jgi:hypothetical protein
MIHEQDLLCGVRKYEMGFDGWKIFPGIFERILEISLINVFPAFSHFHLWIYKNSSRLSHLQTAFFKGISIIIAA